jgi:DNA-directed RNA polymerase omega subunit
MKLNYQVRKPLELSRGPSIDNELCTVNAGGNRFNLVLIAAARAREIRRQHASSLSREHVHSIVTALKDIQEGKIDPLTYLKKVK